MRAILKVGRKGVTVIPKKLREALGIEEGEEVLAEVRNGELVLRPLKPRIVDVDPSLIWRILEEEGELEEIKFGRISEKTSS